ncbi:MULTISPECIES: M16 family metallopeptidase [Thermus]|jgi:predicted Zn-dependent peptidase|uniref:Zinc protease n=1 Tax=Thermus brockianus TaxID=56956 RepID=A0A1J0LWQ7_THEBO|nr:pitrilysin family protein [Thermus brockianus]APD10043.1 zinc protease [Thermus brockianus]BDG16644.1 zinc protease [Thermus brockianus]
MFREAELKNGLKVIAEVLPEARSVALGYFVKTGARDERAEESGVSHFLEHMVFKGPEGMDALSVNLAFDRLGAQYNAFTSEEATVYYGAVLPEFAFELLTLFSRLLRPALRQEDFDTEKKVILEEIARYQDRPGFMAYDWARARFFQGHPLGNSVLGTVESITALTRDQMAAYHARRYLPKNMVLAATGKVDFGRLLAEAEALTADWPQGEAERSYPPLRPAFGVEERPYEKARALYLVGLFPGVAYQEEKRFPAQVLAHLLGEEGSGRLHFALVDRGLAEVASFGHEEGDRAGFFHAYVQADPGNKEGVLAALQEELSRLRREGVGEEEVERAKTPLATALVFAGETPMGRLFHLGMEYLYTGRYLSLGALKERIGRVSAQEVNALLEEGLLDQGLYYLVLPHGA